MTPELLNKLKHLANIAAHLPSDVTLEDEDAAMKALHGELAADTVLQMIALAERALLAAAPAPIQQEPEATHKRQVFMDEIDAAAAGSEWIQPFFTPNFSLCFSVDEGARAPRAKWCMLFDSLDRVVAGYILTRDAKNWTELTKVGPRATPPALAGSQVQAAGDALDAARYRFIKSKIGMYAGWWQVQIPATSRAPMEDLEAYFEFDIDAVMQEQP